MRKIKYILFIIVLMLFKTNVYADTIYNLDMDIYLNEDGSARITEIWDVRADSGSEWYKQLYNMGNQELSNFNVSMDGKNLIYKDWNVDEDLSQKSGYYGINYVSDGIELCFGKVDMNRHKFILSYELSNVIFNTDGDQVMYQTLFPNVTADNFSVTVSSFYKFPDTLDVWGYGYKGYAYVENGYIKMSNEENSSLNGDYVVLLVKFPQSTFNTSNYDDRFNVFDDVLTMAQEGTYEYDYGTKTSFVEIIMIIFSILLSVGLPILIIILSALGVISNNKYGTKKLKFSKDAKKIKDAPYFRDIPLNKDIFKGYWIACQYNLIKKQTDFLGALLLKWLKNGNIENTTVISKILKKEQRAIKLVSDTNLSDTEKELYNMMSVAALDGILEKDEFKVWCKDNYSKILKWFDKVIDDVTLMYQQEGLITTEKGTFSTNYVVSDGMKEYAMQVAGLKKFLNDFSRMNDKQSIEVNLWEEYLMFAQIFGIADKVAKEFKNLYPDVITDETYNNVIFIHDISYASVKAASAARSAAESYSSGGGGFSSGGGGFGSFGGGGSMGGR